MNKNRVDFNQGKIPYEENELPRLYFVVISDWLPKLGDDAFLSYLKMWTYLEEFNVTKKRLPQTLEELYLRLGMGKKKFYEKIVRPLWNYGLIDIEDALDDDRKSNKPKNIIVYKYPQNRIELASKPLEKCRDYDTDYNSNSVNFGRKGGRPKHGFQTETIEIDHGFEMETVENARFLNGNGDGFQIETVENDHGFQTETVRFLNGNGGESMVSKQKPCVPSTNISSFSSYSSLVSLVSTTTSSDNLDEIDNELKAMFPDKPFERVKQDVLLDADNGALIIETPEQYRGMLKYRLEHFKEKTPRKGKPIRTEILPDWFEEEKQKRQNIPKEEAKSLDEQRKEIDEILATFRK